MSCWSEKKSGIVYPYFSAEKSDSPASPRQAPAFDSLTIHANDEPFR